MRDISYFIKKTVYCFAFLLMLLSCEDTVTNFEIESKPARIVLSSILEPDSVVKIHVSKSLSIDEAIMNKTSVSDARVVLYKNGTSLGKLEHDSGGYFVLHNYYPTAGNTYRVEVEVDNCAEVWAETTIPETPIIQDLDMTYKFNVTKKDCYGCLPSNRLDFEIKLHSFPEKNYYIAISARGKRYSIDYGEGDCEELTHPEYDYIYYGNCVYPDADTLGVYNQMIGISTNDFRNTFYRSFYDYYGGGYYLSEWDFDDTGLKQYFSTEHFRKEELHLNIYVEAWTLMNNAENEIDLFVYSYDEDYYKFLLSLARWNEAEDFLFTEKVSIYSNVENGLGIFGSASASTVTIEYDLDVLHEEMD